MAEFNINHAIKQIAATPEGENLLLWLESEYHAKVSFVAGDSHATAYNEGARSVVLDLLSRLAVKDSQQE